MTTYHLAGASISQCGRYRYGLTRRWADSDTVPPERNWLTVVMLNPSTADAALDDPTIRRCVGYAKREGYAALSVRNLYAYRATDPKALLTCTDAVGPENDWVLRAEMEAAAEDGRHVLAAWGVNGQIDRVLDFIALSAKVDHLVCLGMTKDGHPRHPLYVRADQPFVPWPGP